jgi:UDP-glucose 4-epimerase
VRVVVTGGAGFIGANLCRELLRREDVTSIVALDDLSTGFADNLDGLDVELVEGSILDRGLLTKLLKDTAGVVHLAARPSVPRSLLDPVASHEANATGTLYVVEAAREERAHVVVASSSSVYGDIDVLPKSEDLPTRPLSPYAVSKLATEAYARAYQVSFDLSALVFRFFNVYGPLQAAGHAYAAVVPAFVDAALRGEPVTIYGDGRQTRDFTYVGTVSQLLADAVVGRVTAPTPVNLAFGTRSSLLDLLTSLEGVIGGPIARRHEEARRGDVRDSQAASDRLRALFPAASAVPLETGLRETVEWFRSLATARPAGHS